MKKRTVQVDLEDVRPSIFESSLPFVELHPATDLFRSPPGVDEPRRLANALLSVGDEFAVWRGKKARVENDGAGLRVDREEVG